MTEVRERRTGDREQRVSASARPWCYGAASESARACYGCACVKTCREVTGAGIRKTESREPLPRFVMLELTRYSHSFQLSLVDKKHNCELDAKFYHHPDKTMPPRAFVKLIIADYKDLLRVAGVV